MGSCREDVCVFIVGAKDKLFWDYENSGSERYMKDVSMGVSKNIIYMRNLLKTVYQLICFKKFFSKRKSL